MGQNDGYGRSPSEQGQAQGCVDHQHFHGGSGLHRAPYRGSMGSPFPVSREFGFPRGGGALPRTPIDDAGRAPESLQDPGARRDVSAQSGAGRGRRKGRRFARSGPNGSETTPDSMSLSSSKPANRIALHQMMFQVSARPGSGRESPLSPFVALRTHGQRFPQAIVSAGPTKSSRIRAGDMSRVGGGESCDASCF